MTNKLKYFIGNWKMFGNFSSIKMLKKVNTYLKFSKINKKKVIFCIPYTLIKSFSHILRKSLISVGAQNIHESNADGPYTGSINSKMIKNAGAKYVIIGHSENRYLGESDYVINKKIISALKNNIKIIFCFGENISQKKKKLTNKIILNQINLGLKNIKNIEQIFFAYEPIWSIGTGVIPKIDELNKTIIFIKKKLKNKFNKSKEIKVLYGGSVNGKNIDKLNIINDLDGYLIGGASQSLKKFIDIIKN